MSGLCICEYKVDQFGLFGQMTYPAYSVLLESPPAGLLARTAWLDDRPAGLAVAYHVSPEEVRLLSVFTEEAYRHQGIGGRLLTSIESAALRLSASTISGRIFCSSELASELAFLEQAGFEHPERRMFCIAVPLINALHLLSGIKVKLRSIPQIVPWKDAQSQREASVDLADWVPKELHPHCFTDLDESTSWAILDPTCTVLDGWVLTQAMKPDDLAYCSSFVRPHPNSSALLFLAYKHSLTSAINAGYKMAHLSVPIEHSSMQSLVDRRLVSVASSRGYIFHVHKSL